MASGDDSKIFRPFLPSLQHIATVNVALQLCTDYDFFPKKLNFRRKQQLKNRKFSQSISTWRKAEEKIYIVPKHLRKRVIEAIRGLQNENVTLSLENPDIARHLNEKHSIFWKSDGSIDRIKTAEQLTLNADIPITERFRIACKYFLEERIKTLWNEIKACGKASRLIKSDNSIVLFWVRWLRNGSGISWKQTFTEYFTTPENSSCRVRLSLFFPSLPLEEKKLFYCDFPFATDEDIRLCLCALSKEEEEEILKLYPDRLIGCCMKWPFRCLLLETANKMWQYIDEINFVKIMGLFFLKNSQWQSFDYYEHFLGLWSMSSSHLKESAMQWANLRRKINSCLEEIRRAQEEEIIELKTLIEELSRSEKKYSRNF